MADEKFSDFASNATMAFTDQTVGLMAGDNGRATMTVLQVLMGKAADGSASISTPGRKFFDVLERQAGDWDARTLSDNVGPSVSLDWTNRILIDESGANSLDWVQRVLNASDSSDSINWGDRILLDSANNQASDWENRFLFDSGGSAIFEWDTLAKVSSGIDFQLGNAADTGLTPGVLAASTDASIVILDSTGTPYLVPCVAQ